MEQLPDDALTMVMQHLSVDDLLACRLVSKRLADLALHRDVWRHQRLAEDKPCVCAVLRLAPCLDSVVYSSKVHVSAFPTTWCAARELILHVEKSIQFSLGGLVLRNQEALGRLRRVELRLWWLDGVTEATHPTQVAAADALLKTLLACSNLESLVLPIGIQKPYALSPVLQGTRTSCLKYFLCRPNKQSESFVNTLLAWHAATLEEIDLFDDGPYFSGFNKETGDLIAGMPKLRKLKCPVFPEMQVVAACKMLRDLHILITDHSVEKTFADEAVQGAAELVRQADQLRAFTVEFPFTFWNSDVLDDLLRALTSSGQSLVERLTIAFVSVCSVEPLLRALPRLPTLRHLVLSDASLSGALNNKLLPGITPDTAKSLRRLELVWEIPFDESSVDCTHAWLHEDCAIKNFLTVNPEVHIHVRRPYACHYEDCDTCALGCHQQVSWNVEEHQIGLFLHRPAECPSPEDHTTGRTWTWLHMSDDLA